MNAFLRGNVLCTLIRPVDAQSEADRLPIAWGMSDEDLYTQALKVAACRLCKGQPVPAAVDDDLQSPTLTVTGRPDRYCVRQCQGRRCKVHGLCYREFCGQRGRSPGLRARYLCLYGGIRGRGSAGRKI